jgi:hypothetical protein
MAGGKAEYGPVVGPTAPKPGAYGNGAGTGQQALAGANRGCKPSNVGEIGYAGKSSGSTAGKGTIAAPPQKGLGPKGTR